MDNYELDDIEALKAKRRKTELTEKQQEDLRKDVKKIIERQEKEEIKKKWAEMEQRFYELNLYA